MLDKVLLIDDDGVTLMLCEFILKKNGFAKEIVELRHGREGILFYEDYVAAKNEGSTEVPPALIFLDLNMPVMNGWDFLDDFYAGFPELLPKTHVVILSSTIDPADYERAKKYDIVIDFINKPLNDNCVSKLKSHPKLRNHFIKGWV